MALLQMSLLLLKLKFIKLSEAETCHPFLLLNSIKCHGPYCNSYCELSKPQYGIE